MILIPLSIISILPLLFYLVDGHYEKNNAKGIYMILGFLSLMFVTIIALKIFKFYFICLIPIFFIVALVFKTVKSK